MTPAFRLVMFDLDGTLVDTAPEIAAAANGALAEAGCGSVSEADVRRWIGQGTHRFMLRACAHAMGTSEGEAAALPGFEAMFQSFEHHYAGVAGRASSLYPDVAQTLAELRAMGVATAVVTNKSARFTAIVLDAHGLSALLDAVMSGDTLPQKKPHPAAIEQLLERFGVAREQALMVGDSETDVATARNAGVAVWAVPYGYNHGEPIESARPDRVIQTIRAVALAAEGRIIPSITRQESLR